MLRTGLFVPMLLLTCCDRWMVLLSEVGRVPLVGSRLGPAIVIFFRWRMLWLAVLGVEAFRRFVVLWFWMGRVRRVG